MGNTVCNAVFDDSLVFQFSFGLQIHGQRILEHCFRRQYRVSAQFWLANSWKPPSGTLFSTTGHVFQLSFGLRIHGTRSLEFCFRRQYRVSAQFWLGTLLKM